MVLFPYRRYVVVVLALFLLLLGAFWLAQFYTDWLWYRYDAFPVVFGRRVATKLILFLLAGAVACGWLALHTRLAMRHTVGPRPLPSADSALDPELALWLDGLVRLLVRWLPPVVGGIVGLGFAEGWQLWLLALYGEPFGQTDPRFGLDVGFYIYRVGAWRNVAASLAALAVFALLAVVVIYAYGRQIRVQDNELLFRRPARSHILALVAVVLVARAALLWLRRYELPFTQHSLFPGAGWTDSYVRIPGLALAAVTSLAAALVCLYVIRPGQRARPAYLAVAVHVVVWICGTALVPAIVQRVAVTPNEIDKEAPFITHALAATRRAFGLESVEERAFGAAASITAADLAANVGTVENIRVWDHRPLLRTFAQLQEIRQYYDIIDVDSDRYVVNGRQQQVLIAARELNHDQLDVKAKSWINEHIEYTHGYGVVISSASRVGPEGQPEFMVKDIPPRSFDGVSVTEPRIYFGEVIRMPPEILRDNRNLLPGQASPQPERPDETAERNRRRFNSVRESDETDYLIVGTERDEFDYTESRGGTEVKHRTRYEGRSGIPIGGFGRRLAFAMRLHSLEILFSKLLRSESRIILHRQVTRRCQKAAPFIQWDTNPYPVVVDGRIYYICEGYTYAQRYPYSEMHYEREMTARGLRYVPTWNYLRNAVKAVVDAYHGTVDLYVVDPADPLVRTFQRIYPGVLQPAEAASIELRAHFRYPVLLFSTQADMYRRYHMTDPATFYAQEDLWAVAREVDREIEREARRRGADPKQGELYREMPPYYITMSLPDEDEVEFMLLTSFTPFSARAQGAGGQQRDNLIGWMVASCDPDRYGRLVVYKFPKDTNIYGPLQVEARIDQDDSISQQITLWDKGGSQVIRGNLLVVPIESALLYVQPLYLESDKKGLPELKRVIVSYGDRVVMEPTLGAALERIFGRVPATLRGPTPAPEKPTPTAPAAPSTGVDPRLVAAAQKALAATDQALRAGDWAAYQREWERLRDLLGQMRR